VRGGYVADVLIRGLKLEKVRLPFTFNLNWNPSFSYATVPNGIQNIPRHWVVLSTPVLPPEHGLCEFRNITIEVRGDHGRAAGFLRQRLTGKDDQECQMGQRNGAGRNSRSD
jgi:hypothetical protein